MSPSQLPFRFNLTIDGEAFISTSCISDPVRGSERFDLDRVALLPTPTFLAYASGALGVHRQQPQTPRTFVRRVQRRCV